MPNTTTPARLPEKMRDGGGQVALALPLDDVMVAHRPKWDLVGTQNARGSSMNDQVLRPACQASPDKRVKWAPSSAGWADHLGAHACPAAACFGEAAR